MTYTADFLDGPMKQQVIVYPGNPPEAIRFPKHPELPSFQEGNLEETVTFEMVEYRLVGRSHLRPGVAYYEHVSG